ncbi:putative poly(A)-specific ribonuclease [Helianthus anomalus]
MCMKKKKKKKKLKYGGRKCLWVRKNQSCFDPSIFHLLLISTVSGNLISISKLQKDLENMEEEQSKRIRGFREVIELISASQKPVVVHNSLNDFTFIHSRFISPLPPTKDEFRSSLHSVFHDIRDINHLMKEVGPLNKYTNLPSAISYLKRNFFAPVEIDITHKGLFFFSSKKMSIFDLSIKYFIILMGDVKETPLTQR